MKREPSPLKFQQRSLLLLISLLGRLPLAVARNLGAGMGALSWLSKNRSAHITLRNLAICFPNMSEAERKALAKLSLRETGKLATEICVIRQRSHAWLQKHIMRIEGEDVLQEAMARGKGVILLAPHIGNWEVLSQCLPQYGKLTALYQPPKQSYLDEVIKAAREKTGAELVPTNRKGIIKLLQSINAGGITAVLPDQNPAEGSGEFSPFFGTPAYTMTMVYGFLRRSECQVVFGICKRVPGGFEIIYFDAPPEIYSEEVATSLRALNQGVEQCVEYCPAQYQWEYKRFKRRPPGEKKRY